MPRARAAVTRAAVTVLATLAASCRGVTDPDVSDERLSFVFATPATLEVTADPPALGDSGITTRVRFRNIGGAPVQLFHGLCELFPIVVERSGRVRSTDEGIACPAVLVTMEIPVGATRELVGGASYARLDSLGIGRDGAEVLHGIRVNALRVLSSRVRLR